MLPESDCLNGAESPELRSHKMRIEGMMRAWPCHMHTNGGARLLFLRYTGQAKEANDDESSDSSDDEALNELSEVVNQHTEAYGAWLWVHMSPKEHRRVQLSAHTALRTQVRAPVELEKIETALVVQFKCAVNKYFGGNRRRACEAARIDYNTASGWFVLLHTSHGR